MPACPVRYAASLAAAVLLLSVCHDDPAAPPPPGPPAAISIIGGNEQSAVAGTELPQPLVVRITDANGQLLASIAVEFRVVEGGGHAREVETQTDASGVARGYWVLGTDVAQPQRLDALVSGGSGQVMARFTATVRPGAASQLVPLAGSAQTGRLGEVLPESLAVKVADQYGNGIRNIAVTWAVNTASGGTIGARSAVSDTNGVVKAAWVLGACLDAPHITTATAEALTTTFTANATIPSTARFEILGGNAQRAPVGTALAESLAVRLTLASGAPVQGAGITWLVTAGGGSVEPQRSTTDAEGMAKARWALGTSAGPSAVAATVADLAGVNFTAYASADAPATIAKVRGDQHGVPGQPALDSLVVVVRDRFGNAVSEMPVTFTVTKGGGTVETSPVTSGLDGRAATVFRLGTAGVDNDVTATAGPAAASFQIWGTPAADWTLSFVGNVYWPRPAGSPVPGITVRLADGSGRGLPGASVAWSVSHQRQPITATTITGANGIASNLWWLGCKIGAQTITAAVTDVPPATLEATVGPPERPLWVSNVTGWPQSAPPYSVHDVVMTLVGSTTGCPVPNYPLTAWSESDLGTPPTGLTVTSDARTDSSGRYRMRVTLGGYLGGQRVRIGTPPPYPMLSTRAVLESFSRFEIVPDSVVLVGKFSQRQMALSAADPQGRAVWGASWRVLDMPPGSVGWMLNPNYSVTLTALRNGTAQVIAWIGNKADTAFVRVDGVVAAAYDRGRSPAEQTARAVQQRPSVFSQPPVELSGILDDQLSPTAFVFERLRKQPEIRRDLVMLKIIGKLDRQAVALAAEYCLFLPVDEIPPPRRSRVVDLLEGARRKELR